MSNLQMVAFTMVVAILGLTMIAEMVMNKLTNIIVKKFHSRKG